MELGIFGLAKGFSKMGAVMGFFYGVGVSGHNSAISMIANGLYGAFWGVLAGIILGVVVGWIGFKVAGLVKNNK